MYDIINSKEVYIVDYSQIVDLIQNVGFPIVVCAALFWYMIKQRDTHKQETDKMTNALNNNTAVLTELVTLMKGRDNT